MLMNSRNGDCCNADCKQNNVCRFQIVNLSFTGRKWPTFNAKVAAFFAVNRPFFMAGKVYKEFQTVVTKKYCLSHHGIIRPVLVAIFPIVLKINILRFYSCPDSTMSTTRSVRRSVFSGSYFFVRLAPKAHAKAW